MTRRHRSGNVSAHPVQLAVVHRLTANTEVGKEPFQQTFVLAVLSHSLLEMLPKLLSGRTAFEEAGQKAIHVPVELLCMCNDLLGIVLKLLFLLRRIHVVLCEVFADLNKPPVLIKVSKLST